MANFKIAAGQMAGHHEGFVFQDSDVYKWLEAAAYVYRYQPSSSLRALIEQTVDLIAAAQDDNGYLDTYYQLEAPTEKFQDLEHSHELYSMGLLAAYL